MVDGKSPPRRGARGAGRCYLREVEVWVDLRRSYQLVECDYLLATVAITF